MLPARHGPELARDGRRALPGWRRDLADDPVASASGSIRSTLESVVALGLRKFQRRAVRAPGYALRVPINEFADHAEGCQHIRGESTALFPASKRVVR